MSRFRNLDGCNLAIACTDLVSRTVTVSAWGRRGGGGGTSGDDTRGASTR